ncbi:MAG: hypothetical protein MRY49_02120 [Candidatus Pacebacteria bacterium]|nr:hypothetical protein [Candidatus Paceibacterota bacterium]
MSEGGRVSTFNNTITGMENVVKMSERIHYLINTIIGFMDHRERDIGRPDSFKSIYFQIGKCAWRVVYTHERCPQGGWVIYCEVSGIDSKSVWDVRDIKGTIVLSAVQVVYENLPLFLERIKKEVPEIAKFMECFVMASKVQM